MKKRYIIFLFILLITVFIVIFITIGRGKIYHKVELENKHLIEKSDYYFINITYPVADYQNFNKKIDEFIAHLVEKFKKENDYQTQYNKIGELYVDYLAYQYKNIVSIYFVVSENHSYYVKQNEYPVTFVYDAKKHYFLTVTEIIEEGCLPLFSQFSKEKIKEKYGSAEFLEQGTVPLYGNFKRIVLDKNKLILIFPKYQVASGELGILEIDFPYNRVKGCIKIK